MSNIQLEQCEIIEHTQYKGKQFIITFSSNLISKFIVPGQFVHIKVADNILMRRPFSVMSVDKANNVFNLLYKIVGLGTKALSKRVAGESLSVMGPIGNGFSLSAKKMPLLIGGGVGMPPIIALSQVLQNKTNYSPLVILASELPFPFTYNINDAGYATMPLLTNWGIKHSLASLQNYAGVYNGYATELAKNYLQSLTTKQLNEIEIFACGPKPMLVATKLIAKEFSLPSWLCLEEYMACATGGCAGCVVKIHEDNNTHMRRVCVDGPVFAGNTVFNS